MKNLSTYASIATASLAPVLALAMLLLPRIAAADDDDSAHRDRSGWSVNLTPVLFFPKGDYDFGGGADPELKYTLDLGGALLSAGGRVGGYYAKNLFGLTVMPTLRLTVPVGPVEPYVSFGMGYGWIPKIEHEDFASMSRLGVVFRISEGFALGVEGTLQKLDGSVFRFPSFGSMISIDF